ncbi:hypothetical protein KQH52_14275 [Mycetohabitans sp. B7]|nr:hypothetical protein [Mycetohabitans sp. B7]
MILKKVTGIDASGEQRAALQILALRYAHIANQHRRITIRNRRIAMVLRAHFEGAARAVHEVKQSLSPNRCLPTNPPMLRSVDLM